MLLVNADGVKFKPDLKGRSKNGRKSIIDMDSQDKHIIDDVVESGMSTFTDWSLVNDHRKVEELPSVYISTVGTCIAKLKPLVENMKNEKQRILDRDATTHKAIFLWCL